MSSAVVAGGAVVTMVDGVVHDPGWVHVEGARIAGVGAGVPPEDLRVDRVVDAGGAAVMPGMVNAHTHLFQSFFRGLADDRALLDWLREAIWPGAVHFDGASARLAALVGLVETLRTGATSVIDHQYVHLDGSMDDAVCEAADELGIRFLLARGWADRNYEPRLTESAATVLERTERVRRRWHGRSDDRIRVELAPLIPWGCSDEAMAATLRTARAWGVGTHVHCAETAVEVRMSLDERGERHVEWLRRLGALGPDVQLAHAVWLDDDELDLVAASGSVVVHCPVSNMYLASGVPRIVEMLERGVTVALASDGPGSNNRQDLFEAMKTAILLQKVHRLDPVALLPEDVLTMACRGGAAAMGQRHEIGALQAGRRADLVVVDLDTVTTAPVHSVCSALVYCATPAHVRHVMVDGRLLVESGHVAGVDEAALVAEATDAARHLFRRAGIASRLTAGGGGRPPPVPSDGGVGPTGPAPPAADLT